jgi:hypothetical protein
MSSTTPEDPLTIKTGLNANARRTRAELGAHTQWSKEQDRTARTAAARENSPSSLKYHEKLVDPNGVLLPAERRKRAVNSRKAYFARLQLKSAQARRRRATQRRNGGGAA